MRYPEASSPVSRASPCSPQTVLSLRRKASQSKPAQQAPSCDADILPASYVVTAQTSQGRKPVTLPDLSGRGYRKVVHVVEPGDSLWLISDRYGVSVSSLRKWNRKSSSSRIRPGQKIVVWLKGPTPQNPPQVAKAPPGKGQGEEIWYTVKPGDSLWEIAREFDVTVAQLSDWNQIDIHRPIRPGLRLRIYRKIRLNADLRTLHPGSLPD